MVMPRTEPPSAVIQEARASKASARCFRLGGGAGCGCIDADAEKAALACRRGGWRRGPRTLPAQRGCEPIGNPQPFMSLPQSQPNSIAAGVGLAAAAAALVMQATVNANLAAIAAALL